MTGASAAFPSQKPPCWTADTRCDKRPTQLHTSLFRQANIGVQCVTISGKACCNVGTPTPVEQNIHDLYMCIFISIFFLPRDFSVELGGTRTTTWTGLVWRTCHGQAGSRRRDLVAWCLPHGIVRGSNYVLSRAPMGGGTARRRAEL